MASRRGHRNPLLGAWLGGANAWSGAARGLWTAELRRQQSAAMTEAARQATRFWTGAWLAGTGLTGTGPGAGGTGVVKPKRRKRRG